MKMENSIEQIIAIVREASSRMVRSGFEVHDKGTRENLVTSSDVAVQKFLTDRLSTLLPGIRLMPWDYAAAALILSEAGGTVLSFDGQSPSLYMPSLVIAANHPDSCERLLQAVRRHISILPY